VTHRWLRDAVELRDLAVQIPAGFPKILDKLSGIFLPGLSDVLDRVADVEPAYTPTATHTCSGCGFQFAGSGRLRNTVVNPLPMILARLQKAAARLPQEHRLELLPETL